jgi:hypothetical protein
VIGGRDIRSWVSRREDISALLRGSIEWADEPLKLESVATFEWWTTNWDDDPSGFLSGGFRLSAPEDRVALHSILFAGIVEWSSLTAESPEIFVGTKKPSWISRAFPL